MACRLTDKTPRLWRGLLLRRSIATAASQPSTLDTQPELLLRPSPPTTARIQNPFVTHATCTTHEFPSMKPVGVISYPSTHLLLPLRKDILHRAVIFEGDGTRKGTASTKWRDDVHGSHRKVRPQKGSGKARLGDRMSPSIKGGGVAFGPTPRDFSTKLQQKVYDLAWRIALSYRYKRGELIVLDGQAEIDRPVPGSSRWLREVLAWHKWGREYGRTLFVTDKRANNLTQVLGSGSMGAEARVLEHGDVDVKDLLELGRVVIEKDALRRIFAAHSSDLPRKAGMTVHDVSS